jgi:hypothetical protein
MKLKGRYILFTAILSAMLFSCTKTGFVNNASLKESINQSAMNLNTAVSAISSTKAYSIFTVNDATTKSAALSDSTYRVYITLDSLKGVYDYHPVVREDGWGHQWKERWGMSLLRYFTKSADDSKMIVRMPLKKVEHPRSLWHYNESDSTLTNNFEIAVSDYHNNYNSYHDFDYLLASEISIDNVVAGELNIDYLVSPTLGITYASQYAFTNSYTADYKYQSGDTAVSSFAISKAGTVLYEEKRLTIKNDTLRFGREHQYILTIGNVTITRKSGTKTVTVAVDGVVQPDAVVEIIDHDQTDPEASVCKKRDVQITFEDGTVTTVSTLIGNSVDNIKTIFSSLHSVYFAAYIVDGIAYDIYYQRD